MLVLILGLDPDTEYEFTVQAFNDLGKSNYQPVTVKVTTLRKYFL